MARFVARALMVLVGFGVLMGCAAVGQPQCMAPGYEARPSAKEAEMTRKVWETQRGRGFRGY